MTTDFDDSILLSEDDEHLVYALENLVAAMDALPNGAATLRASFQDTLEGWLASYGGPMDPDTAWNILVQGWGVDGLRKALQATPGCPLHKLLVRAMGAVLRDAHTPVLLELSEDAWDSLLAMGFPVGKLFQGKPTQRALLEAGLTGDAPWMLDAWATVFPRTNPLYGYWRAVGSLALPDAPLCDQALPQAFEAATALAREEAPRDLLDRMVHHGMDERLWAVVVRMAYGYGTLQGLKRIAFGCMGDKKALDALMGDARSAHADLALALRLNRLESSAHALQRRRPPRDGTPSFRFTLEDFFPTA